MIFSISKIKKTHEYPSFALLLTLKTRFFHKIYFFDILPSYIPF